MHAQYDTNYSKALKSQMLLALKPQNGIFILIVLWSDILNSI